MTDATVLEITRRALVLAVTISAPILCTGLLVGMVISIFQAATQIHEMSLTFIPKVIAVAVALLVSGQWMLTQMVTFTTNLLQNIPSLIK